MHSTNSAPASAMARPKRSLTMAAELSSFQAGLRWPTRAGRCVWIY